MIIAVYRYIALLRSQTPDNHAFDEIKALSDIEFRFYEPSRGSEYASEIAKGLQASVPREAAISGRWLLDRFDASAIADALERLDIRKGNVAITAKVMPPGVGPLDRTEPVYGTRYRKDRMPADVIAALEGNPIPELFLPGPNRFIPKNFDVDKIEVAEVGRNLFSEEFRLIFLAYRTPRCLARVRRLAIMAQTGRHILGAESQRLHRSSIVRTKTCPGLQLIACRPILNASANKVATARFFFELYLDAIAEELYDVERAGQQFSVETTPTAVVVKVIGSNDTLAVLTTRMLGLMRRFVPGAKRFDSVKDQVSRFRPL